MNESKLRRAWISMSFTVLVGVLMVGDLAPTPSYAEPPPGTNSVSSATKSVDVKAISAKPAKVTIKYQLTGAELYSINCNRCHPERSPSDWTGAQWKTIMLQMQVRANIPAKQAKLILQYLQENSGR